MIEKENVVVKMDEFVPDEIPKELIIKLTEFYYDDINKECTLETLIEIIKNKFDFSNPNYKTKIVPYITTRDDYNGYSYDEILYLECITYRIETNEEIQNRIELQRQKFYANQEENIRLEKLRQEEKIKKEQKESKEKLKQWYNKAKEHFSPEQIEEILK